MSIGTRLKWLAKNQAINEKYLISSNGDRVPFDPEPYEYLAGVYRRMGRRTDARRVLVEMEKHLERQTPWWHVRRWVTFVWGRLAGYGYRTDIPAWISLGWLVLSACLWSYGYHAKVITAPNRLANVAEHQIEDQRSAASYPGFNALIYAVDVFVPLVDLEQTKYWQSMKQRAGEAVRIRGTDIELPAWRHAGRAVAAGMWLSIVAGWGLTTLFAAGLTKSVRE